MAQNNLQVEDFLAEFRRVMLENVEHQEDPNSISAMLEVASQWLAAAQMLLQHEAQMSANAMQMEMNKQKINRQDELHQQILKHNEQSQSQKHQDATTHKAQLSSASQLATQNKVPQSPRNISNTKPQGPERLPKKPTE